MKRLKPFLLVLILAVLVTALLGCDWHNHQDINKDGKCDVCFETLEDEPNGEGDASSFVLSADKTAVYSGDDVTLSVSGIETLGSYNESDVQYKIVPSGESVSAALDGMKLTLSGSGSVTVKATVGENESAFSIDVLPDTALTRELIGNAVSAGNAYLGVSHDIGLTAENAKYYNIVGEEDYVRINADGTLEIIGARAKNSVLKVTALNGDLVFEKFYTVTGSSLVAAVREGLLAEGKIGSRLSDIPHSKLALLENLSAIPASPFSELDYKGFKFLTSLKSLDLSGNSLGDLSFLRGLDDLGRLDLSYTTGLDISDGGIKVVNNIKSLPSLSEIAIFGSLSYVNREIYDALHTMAANGEIILEVVEGIKVSGADIDAFSETVFFSIDECMAHAERNSGVITPEGEFTHAVISVPYEDENKYFKIDASKLCLLELYGSPLGGRNSTPTVSDNSLTVNLYNYSLSAPKIGDGNAIAVCGDSTVLTLVLKRGVNTLAGANWDQVKMPTPGSSIVCDDLEVYSENGATLSAYGGFGCTGAAGGWSSGPLAGGQGGDGASAIVCNKATFHTYNLRITGGNGGQGGKGCDGAGEFYESVHGYFNGAKGGKGGTGGYALYCAFFFTDENMDKSTFINACLFGGPGGNGGAGGAKHMLGNDGECGDTGNVGKRYLGETGSVTGPIH